MIRVLQYGLSSNKGGIESVCFNIFEHLEKTEFMFDFLIYGNSMAYEEEFSKQGSTVYSLKRYNHNPIHRFIQFYRFFKANANKFDVIHCSYMTLYSIEPVIFAKIFNIPKIIVHARGNSHYTKNFLHKLSHIINKKIIDFCATDFISCSVDAAEFLFSKKCIKQKKYEVIYNPVEINKFRFSKMNRERLRAELNINDNFVIGHVGAFLPIKNHKFLLEVFKEILIKKPDAILLLIGSGSENNVNDIICYAKELSVWENVQLLGVRDDVNELLSAMDMFVFPSFKEGFGNVLVEAQVSGLSCVISDTITSEVIVFSNKVIQLPLKESNVYWAKVISNQNNYYDRNIEISKCDKISLDRQLVKYQSLYRHK